MIPYKFDRLWHFTAESDENTDRFACMNLGSPLHICFVFYLGETTLTANCSGASLTRAIPDHIKNWWLCLITGVTTPGIPHRFLHLFMLPWWMSQKPSITISLSRMFFRIAFSVSLFHSTVHITALQTALAPENVDVLWHRFQLSSNCCESCGVLHCWMRWISGWPSLCAIIPRCVAIWKRLKRKRRMAIVPTVALLSAYSVSLPFPHSPLYFFPLSPFTQVAPA